MYGLVVSGQLTSDAQHQFDSLYAIAINPKFTPDERAEAYNRSCWKAVYQDYQLGLKVSVEYQKYAEANHLDYWEVSSLHFLGYSQLMLGRTQEAERSHQKGLALSLKINELKKAAEAYADIGNLRHVSGDTDGAIYYHEKCLALARKISSPLNETRALINIGEIYEAQGRFDKSLESFRKALSLSEDHSYVGFYSSIYEHLGDVNLSIEEYKIAEKYYRLALSSAVEVTNENRRIRSLDKLGQLHQARGMIDSAMIYYNQALTVCIQKEIPVLSASIRSNMASVYVARKENDKALIEIKKALHDFEEYNVVEGLEEACLIAGKLYLEVGRLPESEKYFKKCYSLAGVSKKLSSLKASSRGLYEIYKKKGDARLALFYFEEFDAYRNSLRNENEVKEILKMEISADYKSRAVADSLEQLREIEKLDFKHQRAEEKSTFNFYLSLVGIAFLSLALIFTAFFLIQKRKSAKLLALRNETIRQALKDKEILLKEVHHRVKNNMQVVSSLLYLKSRNMPDEVAKAALLDSKSRIDSMQLSHQRMYQNGNYEQIDIVGYSKDIFQVLLDPIKREADHFEVRGGVQLIHVEQSQTLGYVIHEFLMNSIKHAWGSDNPKRVELSIERRGDTILLHYSDNGKGLAEDFDLKTTKSFGMSVINSLVTRQLKGVISITNAEGVNIHVEFEARGDELEMSF